MAARKFEDADSAKKFPRALRVFSRSSVHRPAPDLCLTEESGSSDWRGHLLQIGNNPIQKEDAHADDNEKRDIELHIPSDIICTLVLLSQGDYSSYALWWMAA